jgi:hypothetical protein
MTGSPDNTGTTAIGVCQSRARLSKDWILGDSFRHADLNEAASAADASRDTIWQGNCDVGHQQLCNNIAPIRNTIPIQYPISNCPAKKGFLQVAVSKARRAASLPVPSLVQSARFRYSTKTSGESGVALLPEGR